MCRRKITIGYKLELFIVSDTEKIQPPNFRDAVSCKTCPNKSLEFNEHFEEVMTYCKKYKKWVSEGNICDDLSQLPNEAKKLLTLTIELLDAVAKFKDDCFCSQCCWYRERIVKIRNDVKDIENKLNNTR